MASELEKQLDVTENRVGKVITALKKRRKEQVSAGKFVSANATVAQYNACVAVESKAINAKIREIDSSPEVEKAVTVLKKVNGDLKDVVDDIKDLAKKLTKTKKVIAAAGKAVDKAVELAG